MKTYVTCIVVITVAIALAFVAVQVPLIMTAGAQNMTTSSEAAAQNQTEMTSSTAANFTVQKTALPGHQGHQAVIVVPQRTDGKIWVGTISWTASKPVEVRLLHDYDTSVTPDAAHGKPVTAPFGNGETAISLILGTNGAATLASYYSGSLNFAADQVAFHTIGGIPFTVTYTLDAEAKSPTG